MPTQNLLMLQLLLMRILLAAICCRFRSWGLVKQLNFCSYFEHKVWSRFWSSGKIWSWSLGSFSLLMFCRGYEIESWSRFGQDFEALWSFLWRCWCLVEVEVDAWSRFWRWNLIKICVWTCDMNSTLGSVVPLAMFHLFWFVFHGKAKRNSTEICYSLSHSGITLPPWSNTIQ